MHAPVELRITRDGVMELDYEGASSWGYHSANCTPSSMQGALWVQLTQMLICNDKINDGAYLGLRFNFPPGTWSNHSNPQASTGNAWYFLIPSYTGFVKGDLAGAAGARLRGGGARALRADGERLPGRRHRPVRAPVGDHQLRALLRGRRREDGARRARLRRRDVEPRGRHGRHGDVGADRAVPVPEPAGEAEHRRPGPAPRRLRATSACAWRGRRRSTRCRTSATGGASSSPACGAATRPRPATATTCAARTCSSAPQRGEPFPLHEPDPADSALAREIAGEHLFDIETTTLPDVYREGDLYLCMFRGGAGLGDPLERPVRVGDGRTSRATSCCRATPEPVYGVVPGDSRASARARARRCVTRAAAKAVPVREWMVARAAADPRPRHDRAGAAHVRGVDAALAALGGRVPRVLGPARGLRVRRADAGGGPVAHDSRGRTRVLRRGDRRAEHVVSKIMSTPCGT